MAGMNTKKQIGRKKQLYQLTITTKKLYSYNSRLFHEFEIIEHSIVKQTKNTIYIHPNGEWHKNATYDEIGTIYFFTKELAMRDYILTEYAVAAKDFSVFLRNIKKIEEFCKKVNIDNYDSFIR